MQQQLDAYTKTIRSGIDKMAWPTELERFFGNGDHFITHYNMSPGPKQWNSEVFFGGRYVLTLQVDVEIDYSKSEVRKIIGAPKFYLWEIESVSIGPTRLTSTRFSSDWNFGKEEWQTFVRTKGDWSSIAITVKTNNAVPNFDNYVKQLRAPRIQVKH